MKNLWDVQIFIHNEEEEFWLLWTEFPFEVISARLQLVSGENMALAQISLMEKKTVQINNLHFPCKLYNSKDFIECSKQQLLQMLMPRINCTVAGIESIVSKKIAFCDSLTDAQATLRQIYNVVQEFFSNFSKNNCPLPCTHKSYNYNLKYLHRHSWIDFENTPKETLEKARAVSLAYNSLLVEERIEAYVYDLENLMTSIGGNLGLFLGFSCFSTFVALLQFFFNKFA